MARISSCGAPSVSRVFEVLRLRIASGSAVLEDSVDETISPMAELLACMSDALRWSLVRSQKDCGANTALPWIQDIMHCYEVAQSYRQMLEVIPLTGDQTIRPTFLLILRLLETALSRGLLTSETSAADFDQLLTLLGHPELPPLPLDLN